MFTTVPHLEPALAPFVNSRDYHECDPAGEWSHKRERVLPSGSISLMINLYEDELRTYDGPGPDAHVQRVPGAALGGPSARPTFIDTDEQRCIVSVNFTFGGAEPFFGVPVSEVRDQLVPLEHLWGRDGAVLRERMLEATTPSERLRIVDEVLLEHSTSRLEPNRAISYAASALDHGCSVSDVTAQLGWLPNRMVRQFRQHIGLTPKRYGRIRRLQRMLRHVAAGGGDIDWSDAAVCHGYYDQAHLINDFRELTGLTPTTYQPRDPAEQNHVPV